MERGTDRERNAVHIPVRDRDRIAVQNVVRDRDRIAVPKILERGHDWLQTGNIGNLSHLKISL